MNWCKQGFIYTRDATKITQIAHFKYLAGGITRSSATEVDREVLMVVYVVNAMHPNLYP